MSNEFLLMLPLEHVMNIFFLPKATEQCFLIFIFHIIWSQPARSVSLITAIKLSTRVSQGLTVALATLFL